MNFTIDTYPEDESGSVSKTDDEGKFILNTPSYDYVLVSLGGQDTLTGLPAMRMLAPAEAKNITPFTTMVAMNPQAQAAIEALGIPYDADLVSEITPAAAVVVQSIQATVTAVSKAVSPEVNPMSLSACSKIQLEVLNQVAAAIQSPAAGGVMGLTTPATLANTLSVAVVNTLAKPAVTDVVTITTPGAIANAVTTLVTSVATNMVATSGASTTGAGAEDTMVSLDVVTANKVAIGTASTGAASSGIAVSPSAVNSPPTIGIDSQAASLEAVVGVPYTLQPTVSDQNGDSLTFSATGLPMGITLNFSSGVLSGSPTTAGVYPITMTVSDGVADTSVDFTLAVEINEDQVTNTLYVQEGWNLMSCQVEVNAKAVFQDEKTYISVWKWLGNKWAVYLPTSEDGGKSYAESKGFDLLTTITPGQGFWMNNGLPATLNITGTQDEGTLPLGQGWNLLGLKNNQTLSVADLSPQEKETIVSLWKWEKGKWAVSLPNDPKGDEGQAYAQSKGFSWLDSITPGEGFWVNAKNAMNLP